MNVKIAQVGSRSVVAVLLLTLFALGCGGGGPPASAPLGTRNQAISTIDLSLVGSSTPSTVPAGAPFSYNLTVNNQKGAPAHNLTVRIPLGGATFVSTSNGNWTCTPNGTDLVCLFSNAVPTPKTSPLPLSMIAPTSAGTLQVTAVVFSDETDTDPTNNSLVLTTTITDPQYDLGATLTASATSVGAGQTYSYTATLNNAGPSAAAGVTYSQTLPAGAIFNGTSSAGWTCSASGSPVVVTCSLGSTFFSGAQGTLVLNVTAPATTGLVSSTGTIGPTADDPNLSNNTASASINVVPAADAALTLTGPASVVAGAAYVYDATVVNNGPNDAGGVTYQQTLPSGVAYVSAGGSDPGWTCSSTGAPVVVSCARPSTLAAGSQTLLVLNVTAPANGTILSTSGTVSITGAKDPDTVNNTATVTTTLQLSSDLQIALSGPTSAIAGSSSAYTVSVANAGPSNVSGVAVTFPVPSGATGLGFTGSSPGWTCTVASGTATCSLSGSLGVAAAPSLSATVSWASSATGQATVSASVGPQASDPNLANNSASVAVAFSSSADVSITAASAPAPATAAQPFTYAITVSNGGPSDASNLQVEVPLAGATFSGSSSAGWTCALSGAGTEVLCLRSGTLAAGASAALNVQVVAPNEAGTVTAVLSVSSDTPDPSTSNNSVSVSTAVNGTADLSIALVASATDVPAESAVTYTLTATNGGPSTAQSATVTLSLPAGFTQLSADGAGWSCTTSGTTATCTAATFAVTGATLQVSALASATMGAQTVTATVGSATGDPNTANNSASLTTNVIAPAADLSVGLTASSSTVSADAVATFTATVSNAGPSLADAAQATFTLDPGATVSRVTAPPGWTCATSGSTVTCSLSGPLAVSASAALQLDLTPPPDASAMGLQVAVTDGSVSDPNLANNSATASVGVTPVADVSVAVSPVGGVPSGASVTFAITPGNTGPSTAQTVTLVETIPAGFTQVQPDGANGWTCNVSPDASGDSVVSCSRSSLDAGAGAALNVTANAPAALGTYAVTTSIASATTDPNVANNTATTSVSVTAATSDLVLGLTGPATADATQTLVYTANVANQGPSPAGNVTVVFALPDNAAWTSGSVSTGWTCGTPSGGSITCTAASALTVGQSAPPLTLTLTPPADGGTVQLSASASSDSNESNPADNSATVTTTVTPAADLSIPIAASATTVAASSAVTFTLTPTNVGPSSAGDGSASGITVTTSLPTGFALTSTTAPGWSCASSTAATGDTTVTCTAGTLVAGAVSSIELAATSPGTTGSDTITASIQATTADPVASNNTSTLAVNVSSASADLAITLDGPATANAGELLTYAVGVTNAGPSSADGVTVSAPIPSGAAFASGTGAGWSCAEASPGGVDSAVCVLAGTLQSGQVAPALTLQLATPAEGGSVSVSATVASNAADPVLADNTAGPVVTTVIPRADLSVSLAASPDPVAAGAAVSYSVGVTNAGPSTAQAPVVDVTVPGNAPVQSATGPGWSCSPTSTGVRCTVASLAPGSAQAIAVQVTAPSAAGTLTVSAAVNSSATADPDATNNSASSTLTVNASADLSITAVASVDPVVQSSPLSYAVDVENLGPSDATDLVFTQTLPAGATLTSATGTGWTCTSAGTPVTVTCQLAALTAGTGAPLTVVTVAPPDLGAGVSNLSISGAEADPMLANNSAQVSSTVAPPPPDEADLAISLNAPAGPLFAGTQAQIQMVVVNNGPDAAGSVTVSAQLPNAHGLSASGTGWSCTAGSNNVTCTTASLAGGSAPDISVVATLDQSLDATASVTSATDDPQLANNSARASIAVQPQPNVALAASAPDSVSAGASFSYSVALTNSGESAATGVSVSQVLPPGARYVSASGTGWSCTMSSPAGSPPTVTLTCALGWALVAHGQAALTVNVTAPDTAGDAVSTFALATSTPNAAASASTHATVHTTVTAGEDLTTVSYLATGGGCSSGGAAGPFGPLALLVLASLLARRRVRKADLKRAVAVAAVVVGTAAGAQSAPATGVDIQRFRPGTGAYDVLNVESANVLEEGWHLGALFNFSNEPLALRLADTNQLATRIVGRQYTADLFGSIAFAERFEVGVLLPVTVQETTAIPSIAGSAAYQPGSAGLGDLRIDPKVRLYRSDRGLSFGLSMPISFPTAGAKNFLGQKGVGVEPRVLAEWAGTSLRFAANVGVDVQREVDFLNVRSGTAFTYGVGAAVPLRRDFTAEATLAGAIGLVKGSDNPMDRPVELIGAIRWAATDSLSLMLGGGPGMTQAYGTPAFRLLLGATWTSPRRPPPDSDHDGILDAQDACVTVPGVADADPKKNGCPKDTDGDGVADARDACVTVPGIASADPKKNGCPKDTDDDGIADARDACVMVPGVADPDPKKNGCPKDSDGDGIADAADACVSVPGIASADPKKNGCPNDSDGDGIADALDACMTVPGVASPDPKKNGCPKDADADGIADAKDACPTVPGIASADPSLNGCPKDTDGDGIADALDACVTVPGLANRDPTKNGCPVRHGPKVVIQGNKVVIFENVYFAFGKDRILPRSFRLLDAVAQTLALHSELHRIRVEGHTDSRGKPMWNLNLSQRRAANVLKYLVTKGIAARRLEAVGYGDSRPVQSNRTASGRARNRRVEFTIVPEQVVFSAN